MTTWLELLCAAEGWLIGARVFEGDLRGLDEQSLRSVLVDVQRRVLAKLEKHPNMRRPEALLRDLDEAIATTKEVDR